MCDKCATLQATLAERERELQATIRKHDELAAILIANKVQVQTVQRNRDLQLQLTAVSQDAARLRKAAQNLTCEVCKLDMQKALKEA